MVEISIHQLTRNYQVGSGEVCALQGLDLDVHQGEFLAVAGVSGSGKSTLLHLIGGLDTADSGRIEVAGKNLCDLTAHELTLYRREQVGFVFQSFHLLPHLTAVANVALALTLQGIYGEQRRQLANDAIDRVGLRHRADHRPSQLSGGEQQRVAVARALANQPRVLLADEPTGNLDHLTADSLMTLIRDINQQSGVTVVVVTHDEELVRKYCDRFIRLRDGQLVGMEECAR